MNKPKMKIAKTLVVLLLLLSTPLSAQVLDKFKFIAGFNFYNSRLNSEFEVFYGDEGIEDLFFLAPQLGLQFDINQRHAIRYLHSVHYRFFREYNPDITGLMDVRSLDRINYMFKFKNHSYLTSGFTFLEQNAEQGVVIAGSPFRPKTYGMSGLNLGFGKEFNNGYVELNNLFALDFNEMTPAGLFEFWTVDVGYYIPFSKQKRIEIRAKKKPTVFGVGLVGTASYFGNSNSLEVHPLIATNFGTDINLNFNKIGTSLFWRRTMGLHNIPYFYNTATFLTNWNNFGVRQTFNIKSKPYYATVSYLSGFDAKQTFPEILVNESTISGFTLGFGKTVNNWMFELSADCYLETPLPSITKGFEKERVKLSVIYNLPIVTQK